MALLPEFRHNYDVYDPQPEAFEPGRSVVVMAKLMVAAMVVLPALLILAIVLVVRTFRKLRTIEN